MGAVNTTYTFTATDTITSTKMNNIIDQTTITGDAIFGTTLEVASGKLKIRAQGITSNELAANSIKTISIENGAITPAKLNSSVILVPTGAVMPFAMNSAPSGWLPAHGQAVSRTTYSALFNLIGVTYGAPDNASFYVPDLRGIFVRGYDDGRGLDASRTFASYQGDIFQSHAHNVGAGQASGISSGCGSGPNFQKANDANCGSVITEYVGGVETRPKNIAMLYCIKY